MRTKKIRGHRRRWEAIKYWVESQKNLDLEYVKKYRRDYSKIRIHPWSGISFSNSQIPEPAGQTKVKILSGLIDIYDSWKKELDKLGETYYLKIWLFEPRFSNSQVVCAIGDSITFYEDTFSISDDAKALILKNYGQLADDVAKFNWEHRLDEDHIDNSEPGEPELYATIADYEEAKKCVEKMLKKPHKTIKFKEPIGETTESYAFLKGNIWLGGK
ncbi:hypothetical protein [Crocinitomix catalasitica]|uniref:hypothetical protein n=1 Tax=Crocinitomix catalasitica TaxID=184607 RepID=UPI0006886A5E|nr:hypothetical protein [Crocinitomix catalasitica]